MRIVRPHASTALLLLLVATAALPTAATAPCSVEGVVWISGTVTPVRGAVIRVERLDATGRVEQRTDAKGRFLCSVSPGSYRLTVICDGYDELEIPEIEVRGSETIKLVLPLVRAH